MIIYNGLKAGRERSIKYNANNKDNRKHQNQFIPIFYRLYCFDFVLSYIISILFVITYNKCIGKY